MLKPDLILGTALWAWTIEKDTCFKLLDTFYQAGYRQIDTATNYPIDKKPAHFRLAENYLIEWIRTRAVSDLQIIVKVGSLNNLAGPENNLSPAFLRMNLEDYREKFGSNFDTFMIHWDNRQDPDHVADSLSVLAFASKQGIKPGLSGIKYPEVYQKANTTGLQFKIEFKHNVLQSAYTHYQDFHGKAEFLAYGINAGGLKLHRKYSKSSSVQARNISLKTLDEKKKKLEDILEFSVKNHIIPLQYFHQLALLNCCFNENIKGILIGPSNPGQLQESIDCLELIKEYGYRDTFDQIQAI